MGYIRRHKSWVVLLGLVVVLVLVWANSRAISDWFRLYNYTPPVAVAALARDDTMTPAAEHLFYINRPEIVAKQTFGSVCTSREQSIVLGCYHSYQRGIFILKISGDDRLDGVMQVTAAHEMLHAAYDRLSPADKQQVNAWLQDYYDRGLTDQRVKRTIDAYRKTEPDDVVNEMHSIFGTEIGSLPAPLETYYSRYFVNRRTVADFAADYQSEFSSREAQVKAYDQQLADRKTQIDANQAKLSQQAAELDRRQTELNNLKQNNQYEAYNAGVSDYNRLVRDYNSLIATAKAEITDYNALVATRNAVALETQQLTSELKGDNLPTIGQ